MSRRVAVLGFHKIRPPAPGGWETWNYVSVLEFRSYLKLIRDHGWSFISMSDLIAACKGKPPEDLKERPYHIR